MKLRRSRKSPNDRRNDEIEANSAMETPLAASLATRETATIQTPVEITKSNPIAIVPEATNEQDGGEKHEIEPNRVPDDDGAIAGASPGIDFDELSRVAIPGLCAAEST